MVISPSEFDKIKKWSWQKKVEYSLLIIVLSIVLPGAVSYFTAQKISQKVSNDSQNQIKQSLIFMNQDGKGKIAGDEDMKLSEIKTTENKIDKSLWEIDPARIREEEDGFYCVKDTSVFSQYEIWYKEKIPVGSTINISYLLKNIEGNNDNLYLMFVFGENREYRLFFPGSDRSRIDFESNVSQKNTTNKQLAAKHSVDVTKQAAFELQIENTPKGSNSLNFNYKYYYYPIPDDQTDSEQLQDYGSFSSKFLWAMSDHLGVFQKFGIGVHAGDCFKIIDYNISPVKP